jgi:hypothetical protein
MDEHTSPGAGIAHDSLPLPDYDHLPPATLLHRIRSLDEAGLSTLLAYESAHAGRPAVVEAMRHRLTALGDGAEPSGGSPLAAAPEAAPAASGGSPVAPATSGPPVNPPSHGDPTNPAQPRPTG